MIAQAENYIEMTLVTCIILFVDPFELLGIAKLFAGAFIVFLWRVTYEVFLTRPLTRFFREVKKKLIKKKKTDNEDSKK